MEDVHRIFTIFKEECPEVYAKHQALGKQIHEHGGPVDEKTRWLLKAAISAASRHHRALETHLIGAREAGVTEEELLQALLLCVSTCGFPTFMEAYSILRGDRVQATSTS